MKTLKRILTFYILSLIALFIIGSIYGNSSLFENQGFYILPIPFILLGQILGFIALLFVDTDENKGKYYKVSACISFALFLSITTYNFHQNRSHEKHFGNIDSNNDYINFLKPG